MSVLNLQTVEIKTFIPAKNFEISKQFYQTLGFLLASCDDGIAYFHCGLTSFLLQDFYVAELANNLQMHLLVENVDDWWRLCQDKQIAKNFGVTIGQLENQPWGMRDFTLFDPAGVLWRIAQNV